MTRATVPILNRDVLLKTVLAELSPPELLAKIAMIDRKQHAIVVSPEKCLQNGISNLQVSQDNFGSKTIAQIRLDFDLKIIKPAILREENVGK